MQDANYTSREMCKVLNAKQAESWALHFLHTLSGRLDDVEYVMKSYGILTETLYGDSGLYLPAHALLRGWRSLKIVIYAAPRGKPHTTTDIFMGILHAFDFENDYLHPLGIDFKKISRATKPSFLLEKKPLTLLSSRSMGVFVSVVHASKYDRRFEPLSFTFYSKEINKNDIVHLKGPMIFTEHLADVWQSWE